MIKWVCVGALLLWFLCVRDWERKNGALRSQSSGACLPAPCPVWYSVKAWNCQGLYQRTNEACRLRGKRLSNLVSTYLFLLSLCVSGGRVMRRALRTVPPGSAWRGFPRAWDWMTGGGGGSLHRCACTVARAERLPACVCLSWGFCYLCWNGVNGLRWGVGGCLLGVTGPSLLFYASSIWGISKRERSGESLNGPFMDSRWLPVFT